MGLDVLYRGFLKRFENHVHKLRGRVLGHRFSPSGRAKFSRPTGIGLDASTAVDH